MNRRALRLVLAGSMLLAAAAPHLAHAQYSWIDDKGTRVFSDRPPPPGTPPARILKAPRRGDIATDAPTPAATVDKPAEKPADKPADKAKPPTLAERDADFRKRQAEREQADKKAREEDGKNASHKAMCDAAREEQAELASGMRISQMAANGERSYISDEERARRLARARGALADCR